MIYDINQWVTASTTTKSDMDLFDQFSHMITFSIITLSGFHCITLKNWLKPIKNCIKLLKLLRFVDCEKSSDSFAAAFRLQTHSAGQTVDVGALVRVERTGKLQL
jgi:hypothetical protein